MIIFAQELLDESAFMALDKHYEFLVDEWVPQQGMTLMNGKRGSGKTTAAIDLACHISTDRDWHGTPVEKGWTVVYVAAEDDKGTKARLQAWYQHTYGKEEAPEAGRLIVLPCDFDLLDNEDVNDFARAVLDRTAGIKKVVLIIDTWGRVTSRAESQSNESDMQMAIRNMETLCRVFKGPAIVLTHPPAKNNHKVSGTMIIENVSHSIIQIVEGSNGNLSMRVTRVKGAEAGARKNWKIVSQEISGCDNYNRRRNAALFQFVSGNENSATIEKNPLLSEKRQLAHGVAEVLDAHGLTEASVKKVAELCAGRQISEKLLVGSKRVGAGRPPCMRELQKQIPAQLEKMILLDDFRQIVVVPAPNGRGKIVRLTDEL
jgi:KaiC/GvpD/RAD55 family RecA-like ATPase